MPLTPNGCHNRKTAGSLLNNSTILRFINSQMLTDYFTGLNWQGQIQYFGKGPGFEFYDLKKLALVEYENGGGGGGGKGGVIRNTRTETRVAEVALRF